MHNSTCILFVGDQPNIGRDRSLTLPEPGAQGPHNLYVSGELVRRSYRRKDELIKETGASQDILSISTQKYGNNAPC